MDNQTVNKTRKRLSGVVVSDKMQDTVVVSVNRYFKHPKIKKYIKRSKRYKVHSAGFDVKVGDKVEIEETKPISKTKRFKLVK
jgi:small subunit ribosomal protein S17